MTRGIKLSDHTCLMCGRHFIGHQNAKLCSAECLKARRAQQNKISRSCVICGKQYRGAYDSSVCSRYCRLLLESQKKARNHICDECGREFVGHCNARVCSTECRASKRRKCGIARNTAVYQSRGAEIQAMRKARIDAMTPEQFADWIARRRSYDRAFKRRRVAQLDAAGRASLAAKLREYRQTQKSRKLTSQLARLQADMNLKLGDKSDA
jgi:hypothetical protein